MKTSHFFKIIFSSLVLIACSKSSENPQGARGFGGKKAISVEVRALQPSSISQQIKAYGTIQSDALVSINPQVSNRITAFYVDLGDTVKVGQALAKIYDRTYRDQVLRDEAQVRQTRVAFVRDSSTFSRTKRLFDQGLSSEAEYQTAQATYQASRAQLASAKASLTQSNENLQNTEVRSPVAGVIIRRNAQVGDLATTGQALFEIGNNKGFEMRLFLPLQDWEVVRIGQKVDLRITNQPGNSSSGVVTRISPQLDPVSGLGEVVITVNQSTNTLYAGALTEAKINIITRQNTVTIPRSAMIEKVQTFIDSETNTIKLERTYSAFVVENDTLAVQRDLVLGLEQGDRIEVVSGIEPGEKLVITGQTGLENKSKVKIAEKELFQPQKGKQLAKGDSSKTTSPSAEKNKTERPTKGN